jgi:F0F1-type ATP synthase assembly protein I
LSSDLQARRHLNRGYGESFSRGVELALVPVVFGGIGWLVDRAAGTAPWCLLGFAVFGTVGLIVKMWLGYDRDMRKEEAAAVWTRTARAATQATHTPAADGVQPLPGTTEEVRS